jgi:hypothetical protein
MTDLIDRADSGDIHRIDDLGDDPTRNLRVERDAIMKATGRLRHGHAFPKSLVTRHGYDPEAHPGPIVDLVDTVTFRIADDLAGPQSPPPPLPPPPPTPTSLDPETGINIFGGLGEHLPVCVFVEPDNYVGRHCHPEHLDAVTPGRHPAHGRRLSPWVLVGVAVVGLAMWAGLYLAAKVVTSWMH